MTTALRPSRPVFTPPPAEDPRPWIPPTPDPKSLLAEARPELPTRVPAAPSTVVSAAELRVETEIAYLHRDRQIAEQAKFEQAAYELAAGGEW